MKFTVPTNWQKNLVTGIKEKKDIVEIYAKLAHDFVGGGRSSAIIPHVSRRQAVRHIRDAHKNGLKFNYLLNATCLDNLEWTISGQKRLRHLLDWLMDAGVDSVTVSIPYLLELIKKRYPQLGVCVSTQAGVDTIERARYWQDLGADQITLSVVDVNRNFRLLRKIREVVGCRLQLIANLCCLQDCPFYKYHSILSSHSSQADHPTKGFIIDYCSLSCAYKRLKDPTEFIRSGWIRPEDVHYYEEIGIDRLKLVGRAMKTQNIAFIVEAYTRGHYNGNLLDLLPSPSKNLAYSKFFSSYGSRMMRYFFRPHLVNIFKLQKGRKLFSEGKIYIDNKKLDGFLEHFLEKDCRLQDCQKCGYCEKVAKRVIDIDPNYQHEISTRHREYLDELISGEMFKYF